VRKDVAATVKFFDANKGFGFVAPTDGTPDAFVHISVLQDAGIETVQEGQTLVCDLASGDRGPQVVAVRTPEGAAAAVAEEGPVTREGTVTTFVPEHNYGLIAPDDGGDEIFFHTRMLERSGIDIEESDFGVDLRVRVVVRQGIKGPIADQLEVL
jgi:CspA family cold shock protein